MGTGRKEVRRVIQRFGVASSSNSERKEARKELQQFLIVIGVVLSREEEERSEKGDSIVSYIYWACQPGSQRGGRKEERGA